MRLAPLAFAFFVAVGSACSGDDSSGPAATGGGGAAAVASGTPGQGGSSVAGATSVEPMRDGSAGTGQEVLMGQPDAPSGADSRTEAAVRVADASGADTSTGPVHGKDIGADNTGPPKGINLTPQTGVVKLDSPGVVWEGRDLTGSIEVSADNVTIRNCKIRNTGIFAVRNMGGKKLLIENCEIFSPTGAYTGISGGDITTRRCNIYHFENGFSAGSNSVIEENYIHDPYYGPGAHVDGIEWGNPGNNTTIRANRIMIGKDTGCVNIGQVANDNKVLDNLFSGGTYSLYIRGDDPNGSVNGVIVTGNIWVKGSYVYGPHSIVKANGVVWSNNKFDDGTDVPR
jgi:hypothetical protein